MEVAYSSEILKQTYYPAWCNNPENPNLNTEHNFSLVNFIFEKEFASPPWCAVGINADICLVWQPFPTLPFPAHVAMQYGMKPAFCLS